MPKQIFNINDFDEDSRLCCECVTDHYLCDKIRREGAEDDCSFCDDFGPTFSLEKIAELVEQAFTEHFERTSTEPSDWDYWRIKEMDHDWDREGEQVHYVIAEIAGVDEDVAEVITKVLEDRHSDWDMTVSGEETEFDAGSHYVRKSSEGYNRHYSEWSAFERRLQSECRFLGRMSQSILDDVFAGIDRFTTGEGKGVTRLIGPSSEISALFRARVFQSSEGLIKGLSRPDLEVGPPPSGKASAGRMNAQGISVFYGARDGDTALAEVRPPVGADVVVAKFEILRSLKILDIAALKEILTDKMSFFNPGFKPLLERVDFLRFLSSRITRPAMPEREHSDYLVTQVIADYLASEHRLDGLIFPSVQTKGGVNIVLFHHACRTEELGLPKGTRIEVGPDGWDEDGPDPNYLVVEYRPQPMTAAKTENEEEITDPWDGTPVWMPDSESDPRQPSLRISLKDVEIRTVASVKFSTVDATVRREQQIQKS